VIGGQEGNCGQKYVVKLSAEEREQLEASISRWQEFGANADQGAHPAEGRRFGGGRRLKRQRNLGRGWRQRQQRRSHASAAGRGGFEARLSANINLNSARPRISEKALPQVLNDLSD
jgi:hypothetical protein